MVAAKTGMILIKEFFGTEKRPVGLNELKALNAKERLELAEAIATQQGLKAEQVNGVIQYR